jgi:prepilin peptidase CpaA
MFWTVQHIVFVVALVGFTLATAYTDTYRWKIPNKLTVPFFAMGLIYQLVFWGLKPWNGLMDTHGLLDGLMGFGLGFGLYFALWIVAGGGGGDVKLMGALGSWLGFKMTFWLIIASLIMVIIDAFAVTIYKSLTYGFKNFKKKHLATGKTDARGKPLFLNESVTDKRKRRILPFAIPVAMAVWLVMLTNAAGVIKGGQLGPERDPQPIQEAQKNQQASTGR